MKKQLDITTILILLGTISFAQWNIDMVDNGTNAGEYSQIDYDSQSIPHIVYKNGDYIYHASWNESYGWELTQIY
ncbi:MAG: hypothetical protein K8R74_13685 [Bacteroidales bacterium]|nr:hypothetical protein [Bacteroidales bacterium]